MSGCLARQQNRGLREYGGPHATTPYRARIPLEMVVWSGLSSFPAHDGGVCSFRRAYAGAARARGARHSLLDPTCTLMKLNRCLTKNKLGASSRTRYYPAQESISRPKSTLRRRFMARSAGSSWKPLVPAARSAELSCSLPIWPGLRALTW